MAVKERPHKGSGHWHYDFRIRSVRYRGAIPEARKRSEALQAEAKIRSQIFEGKFEAAAKPVLFSKFLDETYQDYCKSHVKHWRTLFKCTNPARKFFANRYLHEISSFLVEKYKIELMRTPTPRGTVRKANTLNHALSALSHAFNLAVKTGVLKSNPCSGVRRMKWERRERYLTGEEETRMRQCETPDYLMLDLALFALNTGMRQGEIWGLESRRVDLSRGIVKVTGTKTQAAREVPLNDEAREILQRWMSDSDYVFHPKGRVPHRCTLDRGFRSMMQRAQIVDFHFHDLRHSAATRMLDEGTRESVIARILGHSSIAMTTTYAHVTDELTRAAVNSICRKDGHNVVTMPVQKRTKRA